MYMRPPSALAPNNSQIPGSAAGMNPSSNRFYELLDALKMEYDLSLQHSASGHFDSTHKMTANEYESKGKAPWTLNMKH